MHNHFFNHLKLRDVILKHRPNVIVECGAGNGENTALLATILNMYPCELHVISDKKVEGLDERIKWTVGLSYKELDKYPDGSIDLCIIDTDHNFWTLTEELNAVKNKISEHGFIAMHDVDEFYHNTGVAMSYWNDMPYPEKEIMDSAKFGGLGDALMKFLVDNNSLFQMVKWDSEKYGAALIQKKTIERTSIIRPAGNPPFAKPVAEFSG